MRYFVRPNGTPNRCLCFLVLPLLAAAVAIPAAAQAGKLAILLQEPSPLLRGSGSQGYLGVDLTDVDQERAQALKLKEVRGAVITLIDHDAPAGHMGLKVNDVVLKLNGQTVEGAEQLRRMLREIPAGRKISILISRDGNTQTMAVELADRKAMEHDIWNKIGSNGNGFGPAPGMGILAGGEGSLPGGFRMPFFGSTLNVGALVEPLTAQMAEYLGVPSGLMVRQVARKSEAATAGLKAFDVILKVGTDSITTMADWDRSLRANQGKPVQVTILRDKKQQTLTLQVDSKRHGEVEFDEIFPVGSCPLVAELNPGELGELGADVERAAGLLGEKLSSESFKLDPGHVGALKQKLNELRKQVPEHFALDKNALEQLNGELRQFKLEKIQPPAGFEEQLRKQMDELKRQMEEWKALGLGDHI